MLSSYRHALTHLFRLLSLYADTYFEFNDELQGVNTLYYPLTPNIVQERLKEKYVISIMFIIFICTHSPL